MTISVSMMEKQMWKCLFKLKKHYQIYLNIMLFILSIRRHLLWMLPLSHRYTYWVTMKACFMYFRSFVFLLLPYWCVYNGIVYYFFIFYLYICTQNATNIVFVLAFYINWKLCNKFESTMLHCNISLTTESFFLQM